MALSAGTRLGPDEIMAPLGAGGMGEVYRATDTNLGREVAIKVLPSEVAEDAERLTRFKREAHLLAALNHPNIAAIYGLEEADGKPFLALELVEGEDLKERLGRGAIPVDEALEIAKQIAEALEEAHNHGIIHRDLKPANVKLTPDGKVKVLDFGLAKAWEGEAADGSSASGGLSQSPTLANTGTIAGLILGTAAYMSPEQARGKPVDKRADVWSFGVLLWEMLTGRALFFGDTVTDVIASVVKEEPDLDALPKATPAPVRRLMARCLRKDPRTRLPDIGGARLELQDVLAGTPTEVGAPSADVAEAARAERKGRVRERWTWAAVALGASALAATLAFVHMTEVPEPRLPARFVVDPPEGWTFTPFRWPVPSPDGRQVLFQASSEGQDGMTMLWTRPLESLAARPLPGTEAVRNQNPVWSPDGRFVAFRAGGELRKLSLADGTVQTICALPSGNFGPGDWSEEGTIVFSATSDGVRTIYAVAAAGGEPRPVVTPDAARGETALHLPQFLPDGRRVVFLALGEGDGLPGVYVASLDRPDERRLLAPGRTRALYAAGHVLFAREGTLLAQPFDAERVEPTGEAVAIASSLGFSPANHGIGYLGVSPGGTLAYMSGQAATGQVQLAWVDRKGGQVETIGEPGSYGQIALSPDERQVALEIFEADEEQYDLWVMDLARGVTSRVTATPGTERDPVWSPDGRSLAFVARRAEGADLRRKGLRASDPETVLTDSPDEDIPESWSSDGETLLFIRQTTSFDEKTVWALPLSGDGEAEPVLTAFLLDEPQLSPDMRWLAYISNESGRDEVYLEPFRREGDRVRVSVDGGGQPKWRGDGRELFFTTPSSRLVAVDVQTVGDRIEVSLPVELFEIRGLQGAGYDDYAPSADGQRFLVKLPIEAARKQQLHVVTNWPALLE